jgi:hypothetical protein
MTDNRFKVLPYSPYDKRIDVDGPLPFVVDNDDVWSPGVEILLEQALRILNEHWKPVYRLRCENEDCDLYDDQPLYNLYPTYCPSCAQKLTEIEVTES